MIKLPKYKSKMLAPRVVVRPYVPWHFRLLIIIITILLLLVLSWGMYNAGSKSTKLSSDEIIDEELYRLYDSSTCLEKGDKKLCKLLATLSRQLQVNNTLHKDLTKQVKLLSEENDRLEDELAYFQHLMSGNDDAVSGVSIYRFDLKQDQSPGKYRYTLLLAQGGQRPKDFEGNLRFLATLRQNDKKKVVQLASNSTSRLFSVNFKHYHRVEESFQVPSGAVVENLQVQVFEKDADEAKLTQTVKLSL